MVQVHLGGEGTEPFKLGLRADPVLGCDLQHSRLVNTCQGRPEASLVPPHPARLLIHVHLGLRVARLGADHRPRRTL
jgi:hypothetical protein